MYSLHWDGPTVRTQAIFATVWAKLPKNEANMITSKAKREREAISDDTFEPLQPAVTKLFTSWDLYLVDLYSL